MNLPEHITFKGPVLEDCDLPRLTSKARKIWDIMADGQWHNLNDVAAFLGYPHSSVTACVRAFRFKKNGGHTVERLRALEGRGTFLYRLVAVGKDECRANKAGAKK